MAVQTDPYTAVNGSVINALEINARFNNLYNLQNGQIDGTNMNLTASFAWTGAHSFTVTNTTTNSLGIVSNNLTTGSGLSVSANSSDASTGSVVSFLQDHASATGRTVLTLTQDAAQRSLFIDQNGNAPSIVIDTEATTANGITLNPTVMTAGIAFSIPDLDALTTGSGFSSISNSADATARTLAQIINDNTAATGATCLTLRNDAPNGVVLNLTGLVNGTYTLVSPILSGTATGTYTLGGTPSINTGASSLSVTTTGLSSSRLISTDASATAATLNLYRNSNSPANSDALFNLDFSGNNNSTAETVYGRIGVSATNVTAGTGSLELSVLESNVMQSIFVAGSNVITIGPEFSINMSTAGRSLLLADNDPPAQANELNRNSGAKAWALFSVTGANTGTLVASYNISGFSVTSYVATLTINTDFSSVNWVAQSTVNTSGGAAGARVISTWAQILSAGSVEIIPFIQDGNQGSQTWTGSFVGFGDQ